MFLLEYLTPIYPFYELILELRNIQFCLKKSTAAIELSLLLFSNETERRELAHLCGVIFSRHSILWCEKLIKEINVPKF